MQLGEVDIKPFEGAAHIAQFVAFAASVKDGGSSTSAITKIGRAIGAYSKKNAAVRCVAAPLVGAGAGGLESEKVVAALSSGFAATAADGAALIIYVLHEEEFKRLKGKRKEIADHRKEPVRVFISHTSPSEDDAEWIKQLAFI
jgi:hypothetical protein